MLDLIRSALEQAGEHPTLLIALVALFAAVDAALGVGALLPGETGVVLAAVALSDDPAHVGFAVAAAAAGAFIGDHVGFTVGRIFGPRLRDTKLIGRLGRDNWDKARDSVARHFWTILVARLMPGIRTFVSAAAGASAMRYPRFGVICAIAATLWAIIWVVGGAIVGGALLEAFERYTVPAIIVTVVAVAAALLI